MKTKKILALALAAVLLVAVSVAGTLAYLADYTQPVLNTFSPAGIDINLDETETGWTMQMIPGTSKAKDPIVSVEKTTTVDIFLFVKFEETVDENYLTYESTLTGNGWALVDGETNVYYRPVTADEIKNGIACTDCRDDGLAHWHLLADDEVSIADNVGANLDQIPGGTMTWTAYAIQQMGSNNIVMSPEDAWAALKTQESVQ